MTSLKVNCLNDYCRARNMLEMLSSTIARLDKFEAAVIKNRSSAMQPISEEADTELTNLIHKVPITEEVIISRPTKQMVTGLEEVNVTLETIGKKYIRLFIYH